MANRKVNDEHIDYLCELNNRDTSVPQDIDTKVALHDIEERGVSAIGGVLDKAMPDIPEEDFTNAKGGRNSAYYGEIKWESGEVKEMISRKVIETGEEGRAMIKFCKVCGNRLLKPRLNKGKDTCSKECNDKPWKG